jgi:hypothetical protein
MKIARNRLLSATLLACSLVSNVGSASAQEYWYMYIKNDSNHKLTKLFVADQGSKWAECDIAGGIAPEQTVKVETCPGRNCDQWIKGRYEDGGETTPVKLNLCANPDRPVVLLY